MSSSTLMTTSTLNLDSWEKAHYLSLTLWDIEREFQKSYEAYEQWLAKTKNRRRRRWERLGYGKLDDELGKTLRLGRQTQVLLEKGIEVFGSRFEEGDSTCHTTLSAQLLRIQYEIRVPLEDCSFSWSSTTVPSNEIRTAAKGVHRECYNALRDQYARLKAPTTTTPFLPPPRFSVDFCPFALQLQKDRRKSDFHFQTTKVRPHDRHDERELCPYCSVEISVTMHSGLPEYRRFLFQSHLASASQVQKNKATFACTSCYKTFDDSYAFLDHTFQKEIESERSCQRRWTTPWHLNQAFVESDSALVEKCLRNCLRREITRAKGIMKSKDLKQLAHRDSAIAMGNSMRFP